jgi:hypothetical protein
MTPQQQTQARILAQIERMAAEQEEPTNDIHAWLEVQLVRDLGIAQRLSQQAILWLQQYGLLPEAEG